MRENKTLKWVIAIVVSAMVLLCLATAGILASVIYRLIPRPAATVGVDPRSAVLERVEHVNKQIFIQHYNAVDVSYSEAPVDWLPILGQDFVVLIRGYVPAGFDLQRLTRDDVWISDDGTRLQLTLPAPQVFEENVAIDFENSRILHKRDLCPWFLCRDPLKAYQDTVLPEGKSYLIAFALQNGILEQAARDGQAYYQRFLEGFVGTLGVHEVRVVVTGYE